MRPEILFPLFQDVIVLPGIGPRLAALLSKAAGARVKDVLFQLPTGLVDRSQTTSIAEAPDGEIVTLTAKIEEHFPSARQGKPYKVRLYDGTAFLHLVYFHARREYLEKLLPVGETRIISGRAERFGSEIQMVHPDLVMSEAEAADTALLEPVYPLTAGLTAKVMRKAAAGALSLLGAMPEWQDGDLCIEHSWPDFKSAMSQAHHPQSAADLEPMHPARERLAFDELLAHQLALQLARARRKALP
ncbi:MAG: ATP-dependent DNA helicase RecG, partial [Maricaulis sp.]